MASEQGLWHVAVTRHAGCDTEAVDVLEGYGYRVYRPLMVVHKRLRNRLVRDAVSLFPGYLFVLPSRHGWEPLREASPIRELLRISGHLACIADDDPHFRHIRMLAAIHAEPSVRRRFRPGQEVVVTKGPFVELTGRIFSLDDAGRINVLCDLLRGKIHVHCSEEHVNPA